MDNLTIKEYIDINMNQIMELYKSAQWTNYTNNPHMLESALKHSLKILGAFAGNKLVGLIRVVGDGYSIIYIQDIIVLPEYQGQGIGKRLIFEIDELYAHVYQKVLLTDNKPKTKAFYESCGFSSSDKFNCMAFVKFKAQQD